MATFAHRPNKRGGGYRALIRWRTHPHLCKTFDTMEEAVAWAKSAEERIRSGDNSPYSEVRKRGAPTPRKIPFYDPSKLLTEQQIVERSVKGKSVSAVYFLIRNGRVVYVGQSVNVYARIGDHAVYKDFDSYFILPMPQEMLVAEEAKYIHHFKPVENKTLGTFIVVPPEGGFEKRGELPKAGKLLARPDKEGRSKRVRDISA